MDSQNRLNLRRDVLHSLRWLAGARFGGQLVGWSITFVVIRILKPSDYGLMAIAEILIGFAVLFQEMGLYDAMVQQRCLVRQQVEQAFGLLLVGNCAIYVVVFATAPELAVFFGDDRLTSIVRVLAIQFPLASVGVVQDAMLSRNMNFKGKSLAGIAVMLGNGFTTLGFALTGAGVWALVYGSLAGAVIRPFALVLAARYWCRPRFSRSGMGGLLRIGSFVTASRLVWYVYSRADVFIIGKVLGKETLGFYSIAMQLASLPMQKTSALLSQVGLAAYSTIQHEPKALRSHYCKAIRILSFVSFPIFWGISCVSSDLVTVVLGSRWEPAVLPLQLLSLVMPLLMVERSGSEILTAIGKPHIGTLNVLITLIIMVPAFVLGVLRGGLTGILVAWVAIYPIVWLIRLRVALPLVGMTIATYIKSMVGPAAGGAIMYGVVVVVRHAIVAPALSPTAGLALLVGSGAMTYSAFMWLLRRRDCLEVIDLIRHQR